MPSVTTSTHSIRTATPKDLDPLVDLEQSCFSAPWSRENLKAELHGNPFSRVWVMDDPENPDNPVRLVAYICAWFVFEEIRFLNLAVRPDYRRQGIAKRLIQEMLFLGEKEGCQRGFLEVRHSNTPAKNLYQSFNFKEYGRRKSYYTNPLEDAILMIHDPLGAPLPENREQVEG